MKDLINQLKEELEKAEARVSALQIAIEVLEGGEPSSNGVSHKSVKKTRGKGNYKTSYRFGDDIKAVLAVQHTPKTDEEIRTLLLSIHSQYIVSKNSLKITKALWALWYNKVLDRDDHHRYSLKPALKEKVATLLREREAAMAETTEEA